MSKYLITYDLNNPGQKYKDVLNVIKNEISNGFCSYWKSTYLVNSSLSVDGITKKIRPYLDDSDRLLVIEVKNNYQGWHDEDEWELIKNIMNA